MSGRCRVVIRHSSKKSARENLEGLGAQFALVCFSYPKDSGEDFHHCLTTGSGWLRELENIIRSVAA